MTNELRKCKEKKPNSYLMFKDITKRCTVQVLFSISLCTVLDYVNSNPYLLICFESIICYIF